MIRKIVKAAFVTDGARREYAFDHACLDKGEYIPKTKTESGYFICTRNNKECLILGYCPGL